MCPQAIKWHWEEREMRRIIGDVSRRPEIDLDAAQRAAFKQENEEFWTESEKSDDELVECAQQFSKALRLFVDQAIIPKQNEKMLRQLGTLVQNLYEQQQKYLTLIREREKLQNKHLAYLDKIANETAWWKVTGELMSPWRDTLSKGLLTSRKEQDLDEYIERIDRLIGLAQPGWSLQTLRTQHLFGPTTQESTDQPADGSKGPGPQWQLRDHKQLQAEEENEAAGIAPTWSFEALKQRERLVEHRLQFQQQRQTQHINNKTVIKNEDLDPDIIDYSEDELKPAELIS